MHELAICQALMAQIELIARSNPNSVITGIKIAIGPLSGVEADLLERAFTIIKIDSVATNATLTINKLPIQVQCRECKHISEVPANKLICKHCGAWHTTVISGDELLLSQVELQQL